jgi:hypothetical protein
MSHVRGSGECGLTSRSDFDSVVWAFSLDLVVVPLSSPVNLCTCTFSTPDGASGNLVDMTNVWHKVLFTVVYDGPLARNHSRLSAGSTVGN